MWKPKSEEITPVVNLMDEELLNRLRRRAMNYENQECMEALIFESLARLLQAKIDNVGII